MARSNREFRAYQGNSLPAVVFVAIANCRFNYGHAGNELRGYGNLVLIKHSNGLISAYAHCEELLVKRGDSVNRGQVIARVGATGGVSEPQLHFELRRGKKPVDPREFLAPAPSAGTPAVPAG